MKSKTIICAGGGTAGSMIPLLAMIQARHRLIPSAVSDRIVWIGTPSAIDQQYLPDGLFVFHALPMAKWRRYYSFANALTPALLAFSFFKSLGYCWKYRPDIVWTSGSFVAVPVAWAAFVFRIPIVSIQQDVVRGLANRLIESIAAVRVLTIPLRLLEHPPQRQYHCIGALTRCGPPLRAVKTSTQKPLLLVLGGSSGAQGLNRLVWEALPHLDRSIEIIHSVGETAVVAGAGEGPGYTAYPSIAAEAMPNLLARATVVVTRAGMNLLVECALQACPTVIVPLPDSHQLHNARAIERERAAIVVDQRAITPEQFGHLIVDLIEHPTKAQVLANALHALLPVARESDILELVRV